MEKDITAAETEYAPAAEIEVEMTAVKKEASGAKSELGEVSDTPTAPAESTEKPASEPTEKPEAEKND